MSSSSLAGLNITITIARPLIGRMDGNSFSHETLVTFSASSTSTISTSAIDLRLFMLFLSPRNINLEPFRPTIAFSVILKNDSKPSSNITASISALTDSSIEFCNSRVTKTRTGRIEASYTTDLILSFVLPPPRPP